MIIKPTAAFLIWKSKQVEIPTYKNGIGNRSNSFPMLWVYNAHEKVDTYTFRYFGTYIYSYLLVQFEWSNIYAVIKLADILFKALFAGYLLTYLSLSVHLFPPIIIVNNFFSESSITLSQMYAEATPYIKENRMNAFYLHQFCIIFQIVGSFIWKFWN